MIVLLGQALATISITGPRCGRYEMGQTGS